MDALDDRTFERVHAYIESHVGEQVRLDDLAGVAGVSRFHFARQFRRRTGESPMAYLLRTRIERAKTLLFRDGIKVCELAAVLGFSDQSHFTRTFRRLVGMPPSAFTDTGGVRPYCSASNPSPPAGR
jgi:AraC family transcriptional regulator